MNLRNGRGRVNGGSVFQTIIIIEHASVVALTPKKVLRTVRGSIFNVTRLLSDDKKRDLVIRIPTSGVYLLLTIDIGV